ncbi:Nitrogen assimilation transcription factor nit-4 [Talaromyces islandicus]|uniref:Nitrogen assimilation transcription factor nit-4 n=1 Tax=Talaromyces islandicus TaxID=28573 RepID=A0A0U1M2C4_TALIS|nr:Nitrogen assimilation transcription factor nit-4 [Talaromyces islandicus]
MAQRPGAPTATSCRQNALIYAQTGGAVNALVARIRLLENTLKQHNIPIPYSTKASKSSEAASYSNEQEVINNSREQSSIVQSKDTKSQNEGRPDRERALIERIDRGNSLTPGLDPEIELLVKRTGSLQFSDHGQLKYFGATSNVHFLRNSIPFQSPTSTSLSSSAENNKSPSNSFLLEGADDVAHKVSQELEDHLIQLYFTWENPYFRVVDEESFMSARHQALSRSNIPDNTPIPSCYSEFLVKVMCSWGALFTDRDVPGISSLHDFFIFQAREKLQHDMDNPTIATVQGLAMMSGSEVSRGRDSRGWLYSGMAAQVAHHLGLHIDVEHYVQSGDITREEASARSTAFWGTYVIDIAWSYYLGRLVRPAVNVNRNPAQTPSQTENSQPRFWRNYTDDSVNLPEYCRQHIDPVASMWRQQLKLCFIMERFQHTLYDKQTSSIGQLRMHTSAVTWALDKWIDELPSDLTVNYESTSNNHLPHVLVLHAQFHEVMIFANHPFITEPKGGSSSGLLSLQTQRKYAESAQRITQIIRIYDHLWTLRRINIQFIHPMFTAAMVHLYVACTASSHNREVFATAVSDLETCCNALRDVGQYMEIAVWQLRSIDHIRQVWYDLLENHDNGFNDDTLMSSALSSSNCSDGERWLAIEEVIQKAVNSTNSTLPQTEPMPWYDTWVKIQEAIDVDPFSVGLA